MAVDRSQTIVEIESLRLEPGAHDSPEQGVCVMEMASLIAHEKFSDHPECVCGVIAAFLRNWNDRLSYSDRQRLAPYAKRVVGTRAGRQITRQRRDACLTWAGAELDRGWAERFKARLKMRARIAILAGLRPALRLNEGIGQYAARLAFARFDTEAAFELLDTLLEIGGEPRPVRVPSTPRPGDTAGTPADRARIGIWVLARIRVRGGDGVYTPQQGGLMPLGSTDGHRKTQIRKPAKRR